MQRVQGWSGASGAGCAVCLSRSASCVRLQGVGCFVCPMCTPKSCACLCMPCSVLSTRFLKRNKAPNRPGPARQSAPAPVLRPLLLSAPSRLCACVQQAGGAALRERDRDVLPGPLCCAHLGLTGKRGHVLAADLCQHITRALPGHHLGITSALPGHYQGIAKPLPGQEWVAGHHRILLCKYKLA